MRESSHTTILAIDGGGTRCRIAFDDTGQRQSVETGAANASTDFSGAVREITEGLSELSQKLGRSLEDLSRVPAFVGLAGVMSDDIEARLITALPLRHIRVADDRPAAVRGVLGRRDGYLGHCGTGSFHAVQQRGEIRLSGGWGSKLGDEASAQWIGRMALSQTLRACDGRLRASALSERLLERLGGASGIVAFATRATPREFGKLAPLVTELAGNNDEMAIELMREGARDLFEALRSLGWRSGLPVCLTGGIGPHYAPYLPENMGDHLIRAQGEPLDGAISLARDFARELADGRS